MAKYKFTYFLNTACAERRPQTRRDLEEDIIEEEREYSTDLEAFEYMFKKAFEDYDGEEYLYDLYEDLPDQDDLTKIDAIKESFDDVDITGGETIVISIEGPGQTYKSEDITKESLWNEYELDDDEDYDDDDYLDENKLINKTKKFESTDYSNTVPANVIRNIDDMLRSESYPGARWKISKVYDKLSIFDWWPEFISPTRLKQMRKFLQDAISIGCDKYCCFKVGASGCANGMWASDKATTDGYSPKGCKTLYRSFTPDYTYYEIDLGDGFTQSEFGSFREIKNYIAEQERLKSQEDTIDENPSNIENKKLNEDYDDDYDLHEAAMECVWEGFDFAQEEFIDNSIKTEEDYKNKVRTQSEDYDDIKDDYLDLEDFDEDEILSELYKIVTKQVSEDFELTKHIEVEDDGEECPYITGWCDEDIDIYDRNDLSEDELWATGWVGSVQNLNEGPFDSFEAIDISCFDNEKGSEYNLPDIPENIQNEFVEKVNKWIEENPDELNESKKLNESNDTKIEILQKVRDIVSNIEGFNFISLDTASVLSFNYKNKYIDIKFFVEDITTNLIDCNIHLPNFGLYNKLKENPKYNELIENTFKNIMRRIDVCNFDKDLSIDNLEGFINNLKNSLDEYLKIISNKKDLIKFLNLEEDESKKLNETVDLKPNGGDKRNWFAFYTGLQSDSYKNNTVDNIAQFGKENLEGLKNLSIEEIKDSHIYWGTESAGFKAFYNGDTYILFDDIEKLPEDMKQDAYENCKGYKKINEEKEGQLEIDEQGLPVLERPYNLRKRNDNKFQITSSHPYDETDYSYAISKTDDINGIWNVYDKDPNYVINSNKSAFMKIGVANDWNEALEFMKKLDSEKKPKIDRT